MKFYIKNMVCVRCELLVKSEFERMGIPFQSFKSGEIEISDNITEEDKSKVQAALQKLGLEMLDDKKSILVEKTMSVINDLVYYDGIKLKINLSDYLKEKLDYDYAYLFRLFAEVKGITIEQYFINQRIERAKEMLIYDNLSLTEIADKLHFTDTPHLSNQFKKTTGLTPSYFRQINNSKHSK